MQQHGAGQVYLSVQDRSFAGSFPKVKKRTASRQNFSGLVDLKQSTPSSSYLLAGGLSQIAKVLSATETASPQTLSAAQRETSFPVIREQCPHPQKLECCPLRLPYNRRNGICQPPTSITFLHIAIKGST